MSYLVDTHVLLWAIDAPQHLSPAARDVLEDGGATVFASAVSGYEIGLKATLGRLAPHPALLDDFAGAIRRTRMTPADLTPDVAMAAGRLPSVHRDPFDRLLSAQALAGDLIFVSRDAAVDAFGVRRLW